MAAAERPVLLYSIGKDSSILLHLARKAFHPGPLPFPLLHVDTGWKFKAMYAHRDRMMRDTGARLIVYCNESGRAAGMNPFTHGSSYYTDVMKTEALFTGLSGSGKSTIANHLEKRLAADGRHTYLLDGDNVRHGLNRDLGFTAADRAENIRRVAEVARLMVDAGLIVLVSFISPFRAERQYTRSLFSEGEFIEVFVDTPIEECERRDVKGLYAKARGGQLPNFTGIASPYEPPEQPEIHLRPTSQSVDESADEVFCRATPSR